MNRHSLDKTTIAFFVILFCGLAWWITYEMLTGTKLEDGFITYRYAQNLALGRGFVFNPGERVLGTTTPLLTLLLALIGRLIGVSAIPVASTVLMALFGILAGVISYAILKQLTSIGVAAFTSMALFFGSALILMTSTGGMETPLVLFLMAASGYAFLQRRYSLSMVLCALLVLTRPDGIVWTAVVFIAALFRLRKVPPKVILLPSLVVLPWVVFSLAYFGSLLPNSIAAKQIVGRHYGLGLSFYSLRDFVWWYIGCTGFDIHSWLLWCWLAVIAVGIIGYLRSAQRRLFGIVLVAYVALYGLFLWVGRAKHFFWYLTPPLWCCTLLAASGVESVASLLSARIPGGPVRGRLKVSIACAVVILYVIFQNVDVIGYNRKFQTNERETRRVIGLWLRDNTPSTSVVAMEAIGYQGYYSERKIIDEAGLVSPSIVALNRESKSNAEVFYKMISILKPDYIVLRQFEINENRHCHGGKLFETWDQRVYFFAHYRELKRFSAPYTEVWDEFSYLTIYGRSGE
jgi:hypothetical protein